MPNGAQPRSEFVVYFDAPEAQTITRAHLERFTGTDAAGHAQQRRQALQAEGFVVEVYRHFWLEAWQKVGS